MLVDDNSHQHELFNCYAMFSDTVKLTHANSIEETLSCIVDDKFDVILLDNRLVPFDSFTETVPQIRSKGYNGRIVVISADIASIVPEKAREHRVYKCLDKFDFNADNFENKMIGLTANLN